MDELEEIYRRYYNDVYRFLLMFIGNREDAQDLTQETFIKALRKGNQFRYRSSIKTWLLSIARNAAIDCVRRRKPRELIQRIVQFEPTAHVRTPEELMAASEDRRQLHVMLQSLKSEYRTVVILHGIEQYTIEETSLILEWTPEKVKTTYYRALKALRKNLVAGVWVTA